MSRGVSSPRMVLDRKPTSPQKIRREARARSPRTRLWQDWAELWAALASKVPAASRSPGAGSPAGLGVLEVAWGILGLIEGFETSKFAGEGCSFTSSALQLWYQKGHRLAKWGIWTPCPAGFAWGFLKKLSPNRTRGTGSNSFRYLSREPSCIPILAHP